MSMTRWSTSLRLVAQRIGQGAPHGLARVERGVRVLEDHLNRACCFHAVAPGNRLAVQGDAAMGRRDQTHDGQRQGGLAAARFAHQAQALAGLHVEADAVDRLQNLDAAAERTADGEMDREVVELQQRLNHDGGTAPGRRLARS
jgi:hypothetical protein